MWLEASQPLMKLEMFVIASVFSYMLGCVEGIQQSLVGFQGTIVWIHAV